MSHFFVEFCTFNTNLSKSDTTNVPHHVKYNTVCQKFNTNNICLKILLCNAPVLTAPDFSRPFKVEVDASGTGADAVLQQEDDPGIKYDMFSFQEMQLSSSQL